MKMSHRILLLIFITLSFSALSNYMLMQYQQKDLHYKSEKLLAGTLVRALRDALVEDVINGNKLRVTNLLVKIRSQDSPVDFLYVTDARHMIFAHSFEQGFPQYLLHEFNHIDLNSKNIQLINKYQTELGLINEYAEPLIPGFEATLHIGINQSEISTTLAENTRSLVMASAVITLLAMLIAYFWEYRITAPLRKFVLLIQRYGAGEDVSFRWKDKTDPEIRRLADAFQSATEERQRVLIKLKESEENISITLDSIGDAVIATDAQGNITHMNPVAEQLTDWPLEEAKGENIKLVFPIVDASTGETIDSPIDKVIATGETVYLSNHTTLISRVGKEYQIADSAAPIRNEEGDILGMVLVFNDVTEQYQLREAAAKNKRNLQGIMDFTPAVIYAKDIGGRFIFVNQKFESLFHINNADIIGKTDYDIFSADFAEKFQANDKAVLAAGHALESEETASHDDGMHHYITIKFPLFDDQGKAYAVCGISTDISERKKQEEQLRHSQKMEAIGQLSGGIAHDFNNQLGVVIGYLDFLKDYAVDDEKPAKWVDTATRATLRCIDLTRQLLSFSRRKSSETSVVDINSTFREMENIISRSVTPEVEIQYFLAEDLWLTETNVGELEDAILNMVINARDAMPDGGKLLIETVNQTLDSGWVALNHDVKEGDYIQLSISDTGTGMDKQTLEHVFEPFFTTKASNKGTGLGMAMVYSYVKRFHGSIKIYSEPGVGTTIHLYLPRSVALQSDAIVYDSQSNKFPGGNESILIVDDEIDLLKLADQYLTDLGYRTHTVENAAQALEMLDSQEKFDLLFSDVVMPGGVNGYELAQQATMKQPDLKVLITSGFTSKTIVNNDLLRFSANILNKPYRKADLAQRIRMILDKTS